MDKNLEINKKNINAKKIYYLAAFLSVLILLIGMIPGNTLRISDIFEGDFFLMLTLFVPFAMWAWLIIIGLLFFRKDLGVMFISLLMAIPHIIVIAVMIGYSHTFLYILKYYVMVLSFGTIIL